jgi:hypothetical protein
LRSTLTRVTLRSSRSRCRNATNPRKPTIFSIALVAIGILLVAAGPAAARAVQYHGYRLSVPASWPVYNLALDPSTCVRFDRHALYLGTPSSRQRCPAHAVGRTEAILLGPVRAGGADAAGSAGTAATSLPTGRAAASVALGRPGLVATATWSRDPALVSRILHRGLISGRISGVGSRSRSRSRAAAGAARARRADPGSPPAQAAQAVYVGRGFDACSAPSTAAMSAWSSSPYRAVGIYIGGVNSACSQPNLTPAWVSGEVGSGWHLIPTYVGYQGGGACGGSCATISPGQASSQGAAAASDAVSHAEALGIPSGNPIYDDMEQYSASGSNTAAVLAFLSGWTTQLHAAGYLSGVYSSASSAITDLVRQQGTGYTEPDDIWIADWNGSQTTSDPYVPSTDWPNQQRLHQYNGGHDETYGGTTINIDADYVDGATADTASPIPDGTFVQVSGTQTVYRIAGGAPTYVSSWTPFGGPQPVTMISAQELSSLRPYPADGTFVQTTAGALYRIAGGAPISVSSWAIFGGPQPDVVIDQWDVDNTSNPLSHLLTAPADGTVVEGLPSAAYWSFASGLRSPAPPSATAVGVDDLGLGVYAIAAQTGGVGPGTSRALSVPVKGCVVPRLKHMTLAGARTALRRADCRLGAVRRPRHARRHHVLRVFGQSAPVQGKRAAGFRINVRLL